MEMLAPLLFALIAASGNAIFAAGQKNIPSNGNGLVFVVLSCAFCLAIAIVILPFFVSKNVLSDVRDYWQWALLSGAGLFVTYTGFNLLYTNYGVSSYVLYAVLSIITTSIIVGVIFFKESFNAFHWFSCVSAIGTVILFSLGQHQAGA